VHIPWATAEDIVWADSVISGTPTRHSSQAWQFRAFIGSLTPLFMDGKLADKVYSVFTSGRTQHGGQESTLLNMYVNLMHFGGILVPPGFHRVPQMDWWKPLRGGSRRRSRQQRGDH